MSTKTEMRRFDRTDIWKEGKYIDTWSLVHLLSGFIGGLVPYYLGLSLVTSIVVAFVLFVLWEFFERYIGVGEHLTNQISDVLFGMLGFFVTYPLIERLESTQLHLLFAIFWGLNLTLSFFGWRTATRVNTLREAFEKDMQLERERLKKMKTEFREELHEMRSRKHSRK